MENLKLKAGNGTNCFNGKICEYIAAFITVFVLFILFWMCGIKSNMTAARVLMVCAWAALSVYALWLKRNGRLTCEAALTIVTAAGLILGVGNMLGTHMFDKGYDHGYFSSDSKGHLGYILNLAEGHLPSSNDEQYYQPPLFHFVASIFTRIGFLFTGGDAEGAVQFAQIPNCTAYCFMILAMKNFVREIGIKERYRPVVMALIAFHPNFFLMGLRGNNDMFATFFMTLCVINTYRWCKNRDMKTIIFLAFSFGFGIMSKISVGVMAFFSGAVMIYCLVCDFRENRYKETVKQFAVFAVICAPLALWYPIRNLVLFDQPLWYVQKLDESIDIYLGGIPWYERFLTIPVVDIIKQPFFQYPIGQSIIEHLLKTSLFVEYSFDGKTAVCSVFAAVNMLVIAVSSVSMVITAIKGKAFGKMTRYGFLWIWIILIISYVQFNISYPFLCSADFRYIPLTAVVGAAYIGCAAQIADESECKYMKYFRVFSDASVVLWCALSCAVYI